MTHTFLHSRHGQASKNSRQRPGHDQCDWRIEADKMLREIAFVLKMTQQVRNELEADEEAREPALV